MTLRKILKEIYDGATDDLLESNRDAFKDKLGIEKAMVKHSDESASRCQLCKDLGKLQDKPKEKHQEFPGWIGELKYNENGKIENKDIIIFGPNSKTLILSDPERKILTKNDLPHLQESEISHKLEFFNIELINYIKDEYNVDLKL